VSAIRFYFDEDSQNHALLRALSARGLDVRSAGLAGLLGESDESQLHCSGQEGRVLFSHNVADFCRLHGEFLRSGRQHCGIVVGEQGTSVGERLRRLLKLNDALTAEDMRNRLEFLSNWA
jgi:hypothetical protein